MNYRFSISKAMAFSIALVVLCGTTSVLCAAPHHDTIYIIPFAGSDPYKDFYQADHARDEVCKPLCILRIALEASGYKVQFTHHAYGLKNVAALISFNGASPTILNNIKHYPRDRCLLLVWEPPVVEAHLYDPGLTAYFGKIFVMTDDIIDHLRYEKFYFPQPHISMINTIPPFSQKKFCTMVAGNKNSGHPQSIYYKRKEAINFFMKQHPQQFDLYGTNWHGIACWRGTIPHKWEVLKNYKFCICFENMGNQTGYVTEKIFDCMRAGCIPIYLGADNITDYVPAACFIDMRNFSSYEELYTHLTSMTEEVYTSYLEAIRTYFSSPQAQKFSIAYFTQTLLDTIHQAQHLSEK